MGTRGIIGFITPAGEERLTYNHYDSYPSGLGLTTVRWLRDADLNKVVEQVTNLRAVNEQEKPTAAERAALAAYSDPGVSTGDDWYSTLRNCQGDLGLTLEAGFITDADDFALDSLFCEWGYVIDLQRAVFQVYRGFMNTPPTAGRWVGKVDPGSPWSPKYAGDKRWFPIQLVGEWSLEHLPSDDDLLDIEKAVNDEANAEDDE